MKINNINVYGYNVVDRLLVERDITKYNNINYISPVPVVVRYLPDGKLEYTKSNNIVDIYA